MLSQSQNASHTTPPAILDVLQKHHSQQRPNKLFLQQFSTKLSTLPRENFTSFCSINSHCDQGA